MAGDILQLPCQSYVPSHHFSHQVHRFQLHSVHEKPPLVWLISVFGDWVGIKNNSQYLNRVASKCRKKANLAVLIEHYGEQEERNGGYGSCWF